MNPDILGGAMLAASLGATCHGMPRQIAASHRTRTAPAALGSFLAWAFAAYGLRMAYTASLGDWMTAAATLPGFIATGVLLAQQWIYARGPSEDPGGLL